MAEKVVSPGVFTNELDQSFLPAAVGEIGAAIIGPTTKGPAMVPTVVSSFSEFEQKFGSTIKSGSNYYSYLTSVAAQNYLRHGNKLTVVRILDGAFTEATASVANPSTSTGQSSASLLFSVNTAGKGAYVDEECTIGSVDFTFVDSSTTNLNNSATQIFVPTGSTTIATAINLRDAIMNAASQSLHGLTNVSASVNSGEHATDFASMSISVSGSYTLSQSAVAATNLWVGGQAGNSGAVGITSTGGFFSETTAAGESFRLHTLGQGVIMNSFARGESIGTNNTLSSGSSDNLRWEITNRNPKKGTVTLVIRRGDDTAKRKQVLETWNNVSFDPKATNYIEKIIGSQYHQLVTDADGTSYIQPVGDYPQQSKYVRVSKVSQTPDYLDENGDITSVYGTGETHVPQLGSGSLHGAFGGGHDGTAGVNGTRYEGGGASNAVAFYDNINSTNKNHIQGFDISSLANDNGGSAYNDALKLLSNADEYDINMLMLPGVTNDGGSAIINKAITTCEDRGDCFVIADPVGYGAVQSSAITQAESYDSNYAAMYWPWVQIQDNNLGRNVWVPPSVVLGGIYAFNDKVAHPWFAPAGLNRGGIDTAIQAERKLTHGNRDTMYESNLNPIATFPGQGVTVFGQKTLQKKSSALDRVNVRRLMIKVKKFIAASSRFLVFEQNNTQTRRRFLNIANPFLEQVQSNSGLNAFKIVMDDTNNTPDVVDRNILFGQIFLQPTKTAEFIVLDFTIQPTGATFPE